MREKLTTELTARQAEVADYEINIDRFARMIAKIAEMPADSPLHEYAKTQLAPRLAAERVNHSIAVLTRDTVRDQLEAL